jgi:hypothetical protein
MNFLSDTIIKLYFKNILYSFQILGIFSYNLVKIEGKDWSQKL